MIIPYKNRQLEFGQAVKVHVNLHNGLFSIVDRETNLVLAHGDKFLIGGIDGVTFKVGEKSRQRVIRENCKNVHAYIQGTFLGDSGDNYILTEVRYNPYESGDFVNTDNGDPVKFSKLVHCEGKKIYI